MGMARTKRDRSRNSYSN